MGSIDHLRYELIMLKATSRVLSNQLNLEWEVKNALVESFVIHARGLIIFLYHSPKREDDVMACDYFAEGVWANISGSKPQILSATFNRASKEVAHITTFRIGRKLAEKHWNHQIITKEIFRIFQLFFNHVSASIMPDCYLDWFKSICESMDQGGFFDYGPIGTSSRST